MSQSRSKALLLVLLIVTFGLGCGIRVLHFNEWRRDPVAKVLVADELWYWNSASLIAKGESPTGDEPYYYGPFYSYALAPLIGLGASHETIILIQHLLGLVMGAFVFLIGRKIFGVWAGAIAAGLVVLSPVMIYYESLVLMETLLAFTVLLSLLLLVFLGSPDDRGFLKVVSAGVLLGSAATGRPALIVLTVVSALWLWKCHRPQAAALLFVASTMVVMVPIIRNLVVSGQLVPITTSGGMNLYLGNGPDATGATGDISLLGSKYSVGGRSYAEGEAGKQLTAVETSSFWLEKTLAHVRKMPWRASGLLLRKAMLLAGNEELPQIEWFDGDRRRFLSLRILPVPFVLILCLSVPGVWFAFRSKAGLLIILYAISIGGVLIPFFITARFRIPWIPVMCLLAGAGVMAITSVLRARQMKLAGTLLVPTIAIGWLSLQQPSVLDRRALESMFEARQAQKFAQEGFHDQAVGGFQEAIAIEPGNYWAYMALGAEYNAKRDWESAVAAYRSALKIVPRNANALYGLGIALYRTGNSHAALTKLDLALKLWPYDPRIIEYRGIVLDALGQTGKADADFREAIHLDSTRPSAHLNYAAFLSIHGHPDLAIQHYRISLRLDPSSSLARKNLMLALLQTGKFLEARTMAQTLPATDPAKTSVLATIDSLRAIHDRE